MNWLSHAVVTGDLEGYVKLGLNRKKNSQVKEVMKQKTWRQQSRGLKENFYMCVKVLK